MQNTFFSFISSLFFKKYFITFYFDNAFLKVGEMKKELEELQPKLEQAKIENLEMMKVKENIFLYCLDLEYN